MNLSEIAKQFSDEAEAWKHIEALRWPDGPICPHCGAVGNAYFIEPKQGTRTTKKGTTTYRRLWKCAACRQPFSVLVGTIFEDSKIPLSRWILAFHLMCAGKNGVSAHELHRQLGITYKSAWHMAHRIRLAMERPPLSDRLSGTVEADETYIGGKAKNMHKKDREKKIQGRGTVGKEIVIGLRKRDGDLYFFRAEDVQSGTLARFIEENISQDVDVICTDDLAAYEKAVGGLNHKTVNHSEGVYVNGEIHTNTVESAFSLLKRGIVGTWHKISAKHLPAYLDEMTFRFNRRNRSDLFVDTLRYMVTADPLTFQNLTAGATPQNQGQAA